MYCNKCGRAARNGDIFCSHCGNRLPIEADIDIPQVQSTYSPIMPPGYEQTVYVQTPQQMPQEPQAPAKQKMFMPEFEPAGDNSKKENESQEESKRQKARESEFTWDVDEFKRKKKTSDDYVIDWNNLQIYEKHEDGRTTLVEDEPEDRAGSKQEKIKPLTEEDINRDIQKAAAAKSTAKIEKFYTFNQKLNEYQKLLDSEYERVNQGRQSAATPAAAAKVDEIQKAIKEGTDIDWDAISSRLDIESMAAVKANAANVTDDKPDEKPDEKPEDKPETKTEAQPESEEAPKPMPTTEERFTGFFEAIKSGEPAVPEDEKEQGSDEEKEGIGFLFDPVQHLKEAEAERISVTENKEPEKAKVNGMDAVMDNESLMKRFDTQELEKDVLELEIEKERKRREKAKAAEAAKAADEPQTEPQTEPQPAGEPEPQQAGESQPQTEPQPVSETEPQTEPQPVSETEPQTEPQPESTPQAEGQGESEPENVFASGENPFDILFGPIDKGRDDDADEEAGETAEAAQNTDRDDIGDDDSDEGEGGERKGSIIKTLIIIAAVLLGIELVLIGIQQLAPESRLAGFINENLQGIVFTAGDNQGTDVKDGDQTGADVATDSAVAEPKEGTPFALSKLVEHAENFNTNIVAVKGDKTLCYNPTETYKEEKINESLPLEYNIWYRDLNDTPIYSDMAVADTLVKYNSLWIDYINNGDETVFTLIEPDSKVYQNCRKAKTGASEKIMKELAIGEIREVTGGFLIWDREVITTTSKSGDITTATYEMVYYLADINYELKVAECYTLSSK